MLGHLLAEVVVPQLYWACSLMLYSEVDMRCEHSTGWTQGDNSFLRSSHLQLGHPFKTGNLQGRLHLHTYVPQYAVSDAEWDNFNVAKMKNISSEIPCILGGNWIVCTWKLSAAYEEVHWWQLLGHKNAEDEIFLEIAASCDNITGISSYKKRYNHRVTCSSGGVSIQLDYVLLRKTLCKHVNDVKVTPRKEIAPQHLLLVCDFRADTCPTHRKSTLAQGPDTLWSPRPPLSRSVEHLIRYYI